MPAYNFKSQFASAVVSGRKRQTIRAKRKTPPKAGQTAYLFTGMRTRNCRRLGTHLIRATYDIEITEGGVKIDDADLYESQLNDFAQRDGFDCWEYMRDWFERVHGLPFRGDLIRW
jgi:hypothetical protein